jgi:hypothetical protein
MAKKTQIYTIFLSHGHPIGFEAYRRYHPHVPVPENHEIMASIRQASQDVEFVGKTDPISVQEAISLVREQAQDLDGLLVFEPPPEELISLGLPMVAVSRPLGGQEGCTTVPFHAYKGSKVVTSFLPAHRDQDPQVYVQRIEDIASKIGLIDTISKMADLRVLVVTDLPPLGYFEPRPGQVETTREEYDETYVDHLKDTFGAEIVAVPQKELFERVKAARQDQAEKIAEKWIEQALALRGTNESEVLSSAKLYLGMKELMEEYGCTAVTTEGFGWPPVGYQKATEQGVPSQGLPTTQFCTEGIAAASETLIDCLITQQLALHMTGSTGLFGDYTIDPFNDTVIVAHCEGTLKPYGDERVCPYIIRNLPFVKENTGGACAEIHYPLDQEVTVAKISMYKKRLSLFTGRTVSGEELFPYWADILGRNKVAIRSETQTLFENVDWPSFGNHRTVFFGDHRQRFKDLAKLIRYDVVEKDKPG